MVNVVLYKSGNLEADEAARQALRIEEFVLIEASLPAALMNGFPLPAVHFCGRGVAFGKEGIESFVKWVQQQERSPGEGQ